MSKPRIIKDFDALPEAILEQVKLVYPLGFSDHLISFVNKAGEKRKGLPFETEDHIYLIRMSEELAEKLIEEDDDYDDDGNLKQRIREQYEEKYDDIDYLNEFNSNEDNDLGD